MGVRAIRRATLAGALVLVAGPGLAEPVPAAPYRAMVERPLFSPTRRPPPPVSESFDAPAPAPSPPAAPDLALSGVIAGGGGGVALLKRPGDAAPVRVVRGGQVDGWTLEEVRPRAVVLRRDERSVTVDLAAPR